MPTELPVPPLPTSRGEADDRLIARGQVELVNRLTSEVQRIKDEIRRRLTRTTP